MTKQVKPALLRMDNVGIVVDDMKAAVAFFAELGLEVVGETTVEGPWVDQVVGLAGVHSDIVLMRTPDGHGQIELTKFQKPEADRTDPKLQENTLGRFRIMFTVTDIDAVVARLKKHGAKLVGEIAQYEDMYRLCYLRGPAGITIAVAEQLKDPEVFLLF